MKHQKKKKKTKDPEYYYYNIKKAGGYGGAKELIKKVGKTKAIKWLRSQPAYTLHKPALKRFPMRKYKSGGINHIWQADLMEMIPYARINKEYKYILTIVDIFSRFAYAVALKNKTGIEIATALDKLFKKVHPLKLQTDQGLEFKNKHVKKILDKYHISHYSVFSKNKAALVERFNRTIRGRITRYFTHTGKKVWYNVLNDIILAYNKSPHRGIGNMKPINITKDNEIELWNSQESKKGKYVTSTISLGDYVRVSKESGPFNKNFTQNWGEEVFRVASINNQADPVMYNIQDIDGNMIDGKFYKQELQIVNGPQTIFRIEKILQTQGVGKHKRHFIKWVGYDKSHNSWILASNLV